MVVVIPFKDPGNFDSLNQKTNPFFFFNFDSLNQKTNPFFFFNFDSLNQKTNPLFFFFFYFVMGWWFQGRRHISFVYLLLIS
jgi:hypothetical protein